MKSDAEDDGLKGKVKQVIEESEDLSGTWSKQGRHISSIETYNEFGNLIKLDSYNRGNLFQITAYGYIDGKRVSSTNTIRSENDPPAIMAIAPDKAAPSKPDPRYDMQYEYKYENGKLVEMKLSHNDGTLCLRRVYAYQGSELTELVYAENGSLNQKYISIFDKDGNIIERTDFDLSKAKYYGDRKYSYIYEFDAKGNWIKKITSKQVVENGKTYFKPWSVTYREITYF